MNYRKEFLDFLKSENSVLKTEKDNHIYKIVKMPFGDNLDILYSSYEYGKKFDVHEKLEYSEIYDKTDNKIYDISYNIRNLLNYSWEDNPYLSTTDLFDEINAKMQECITNYVLDNLDEFYEAVPNEYESYAKEVDVYKYYFDNITKLKYKSDYNTSDYDTLLKYLDKGDDFIYDLSFDYIKENKEYIGEYLVNIDTKNKFLENIENDKNHRIHKIKDIVDSLKDVDCNMIHVFIHKDGLNYDFKYGRERLLNSYDYTNLYTWDIPAKERNGFENLFGRNADFNYDDITKIEFRNKIIYLDKNFDNKKDLEKGIDEELEL